ncbi:MAG: MMPL family transporter [Nitrososphaerota archaeon]|nr:MMPL family transporter [Nitrososphaerota archaeon]
MRARLTGSRYGSFNSFIRRRRRWIITAWAVAVLLSVAVIPSFFSSVSYNITNVSLGQKSSESQVAQRILSAQFPSANSTGQDSIVLVIQPSGGTVYSDQIRGALQALNQSVASDPAEKNYTGMSSVYSTEYALLNSTVPALLPGVASLASNVTAISASLYALRASLSTLNSNVYQLSQGINQTSQLVYGIPAGFVQLWGSLVQNGSTPAQADAAANQTVYTRLASEGAQGAEGLGYYQAFYSAWNSSFTSQPALSPLQREGLAVNASAAQFAQSPALGSAARELMLSVATGLNTTDWYQTSAVSGLAIGTVAAQIPGNLTAPLKVTPLYLARSAYALGQTPTSSSLADLTVGLVANASSSAGATPGVPVAQLVRSAYALGPKPSAGAAWTLASGFVANATAKSLAGSPLFAVDRASLASLLAGLRNDTAASQVRAALSSLVESESHASYPLALSRSLTQSFVSQDNQTMIAVFDFSSHPGAKAIAGFQALVASSNMSSLATTYVTGGAVLAHDVQDVFSPSLGVTVVAGVIVSIVIVGLLFMSPLAALVPLLIGGLSISIAYASIYLGIVKIGHGQISFLTPTLTTLLMLGLAVDYSVLQLRRTREERTNGRSKEESVATSVRWAGEGVLTAGTTVVVAYVVMAAANVPIFSDVGVAIAIGVSILLLASLTLLPSLELTIGDRLFWPGLRGGVRPRRPSRLERVSEKTMRHKVAVAALIALVALGAVYATANTPTSLDFLRLVPNFQSNQGLTVITDSFGSGTISPSTILVQTPAPIVNGHNQFNQAMLNEIEQVSAAAAGSPGVDTVTSATRPYGSAFNYSSVQGMSAPLKAQYLTGMMAQVGKDNSTALVLVGFTGSSESAQAVSSLQGVEAGVNSLPLAPGTRVYYGGETQGTYDSEQFMSALIPQVLVILAAAVYVILFLQLRSVFTPLRLVFTILCSVAFALALLSVTFYHLLSMPVFNFAPLFVLVTMLGVGIDYDIFYVTRIREEALSGKSDAEAIKAATTKVWVTIVGLGLVLSSVFGSLLLTGIGMLQEISLAVSAAVVIDVTVVILFFVPALMAMAARYNWWPSKLGRRQVES